MANSLKLGFEFCCYLDYRKQYLILYRCLHSSPTWSYRQLHKWGWYHQTSFSDLMSLQFLSVGNMKREWEFVEAGQCLGSEVCGWDLCLNHGTAGYCDDEKLCCYFRIYFHYFLNEPNDSIWVHCIDRWCYLQHYIMFLAHGKHPLATLTNVTVNIFFVKRYFWLNCPLKPSKFIVMHLIFLFSGFLCVCVQSQKL